MSAALVVLIVLGFAAVLGGLVWAWLDAKKRRQRIEAWAAARDWSYEKVDRHMEHGYRGLRPFGQGGRRHCRHILRGDANGVPACIFQYEYTVSTGKSSHTSYFVVVDLEMPLDGHGLSIEREHIGHKIFDLLGGEDINFESDEFSRRFWVRCAKRRFAYDVIHPAVMTWLLERPKLHWQWQARTLLLHEPGRMDVKVAQRLLEDALAFRAMIPRHLLATD